MAVDAAMLDARASDACEATLRLYSWDRPTVTLGRFQDVRDVDEAVLGERGLGLARRPTGGRGVLHDAEVTYSVVASLADGVPRGVAASYRFLCGGLVAAYDRLGLEATIVRRSKGRRTAACYLHSSQADLSAAGAKLSGSAQVWSRGAVLQHGSVVISRDPGLESAVFRLSDGDAMELGERTTALDEALSRVPATTEVEDALIRGFAQMMEAEFEEGVLSRKEFAVAIAAESTYRLP